MLQLPAIVAALLLTAGDNRPPPHPYYVSDGQRLTPELVRAQDACAEEAYRRIKQRGGRFDPNRYDGEMLRCVSERGLLGGPEIDKPKPLPPGALAGGVESRRASVTDGWTIEGYQFEKYPGFDSGGNIKPVVPPTPAEVAAIRRCLPIIRSEPPQVAAAFMERCLGDLGYTGISLVRTP